MFSLETLLEMRVPKHLIQLLEGFSEDQSAVIKTEFGDTDSFKIKKGVGLRQRCILSQFLFNLLCRENNEKSRNGRGKRRSKNSRKDTEQLEIRGPHVINGRKKCGSDKTNKKVEDRKRKSRPIFQHKEDQDYDNSRLGQLRYRRRRNRSGNKLYVSRIRSRKRWKV